MVKNESRRSPAAHRVRLAATKWTILLRRDRYEFTTLRNIRATNDAPALLARLATTLQIIIIRACGAGVSDDASVCRSNAHRFDTLSSYNARATVTRILFNAIRNYKSKKKSKKK